MRVRGRHRHCGRRHPLFRDIVKALAAGADLVMLGGLLAGTEESPGKVVHYQGRHFKQYRGMGSWSHAPRLRRPLRSEQLRQARRGRRGSARSVQGHAGGRGIPAHGRPALRHGLSGRAQPGGTPEQGRFVQITSGGLKESHPHDITITEEPVNYSC